MKILKKRQLTKKKNEYIKLIYKFDNYQPIFQCRLSDKIKDINKRFWSKTNPIKKKVFFYYNGLELDEELTIEEIINEKDIERNKMVINVSEVCDIDEMNIDEVTCPKCYGNIFIKLTNFKINLEDCQNGHTKNNISLNDFMKTQKSDSNLYCDICFKKLIHQISFYKCFSCKKTLCQKC